MPDTQILAVAAYLPLLRFDRKAARSALGWSGLGGSGRGTRAVAGWDEDSLTMAVEAARGTLGSGDGADIARVTFASTSSPFIDRSQSGVLIEALQLNPAVEALDVSGTRRCAVAALSRALANGVAGAELVVAGEDRHAQPGSSASMNWGAGAGAVLVGKGQGIAKVLTRACVNFDLLDFYTSAKGGDPYAAEDRFVRDEAVAHVYGPAFRAALKQAGLTGADIAIAVVPEPVSGTYGQVARGLKMTAPNVCEEIAASAGELGSAMPLFGLSLALERANAGDRVLVAGFGNGCEVLILEATGKPAAATATEALDRGAVFNNYLRFLSLTDSLSLDWGPRAEVNQKTSASTLARHGRDTHGFVGGRDARGNVQFPKTPIPVSPLAEGPEQYEDVVLRDVPAKVTSVTADRLNFTPDPPFYFGLVQFENGARVAMEYCDCEGATPKVGDPVAMRFRVKAIDRQRNFRTYFWKAAPIERPVLAKETK
ncbi:MAG: hypothetical protein H6883_00235 [Rhodobiaceae bacterium]|nr:hypothetical protein [Rhodobiaceae bacterium]MCC0054542.1 hypothetical protein [Rhodobiaceae bacterium]